MVVVADDDPDFLRIVERLLVSWGHGVVSAIDKESLLRCLDGCAPALVLLDVRFGDHDGLEVLRQLHEASPHLRVVMLTAFGSIDSATSAIKLGAFDYLTKPVDREKLRNVVREAIDAHRARTGRADTAERADDPLAAIVGEGALTQRLRELIRLTGASEATTLVLGESGTGKEIVARALHGSSPRRAGPFIPLNVAALPHDLVESTLFGHVRGAFTGADTAGKGCCEAADGGTLFLDEIGDMDPGLQAKLLRFLQDKSFLRVGDPTPRKVDVRIVAATNRVLPEQVAAGRFRGDLYYRLNVVTIEVPPLRDRREEIPVLARHFLAGACARHAKQRITFAPEGLAALDGHAWPGNVRELENLVERLTILHSDGTALGPQVRAALPLPAPQTAGPVAEGTLTEIERVEKGAIERALAAASGNVREAARALGLGQATVYRKIKRYDIPNH